MALRAVPDHENAPKPLEVFGFGRAHEVNSSEPADEFSREKCRRSQSFMKHIPARGETVVESVLQPGRHATTAIISCLLLTAAQDP